MSVQTGRRGIGVLAMVVIAIGIWSAKAVGSTLDRDFGHDGIVLTAAQMSKDPARFLAVKQDRRGRLVAVGHVGDANLVLARYRRDGRLDRSFGDGGIVQTNLAGGRLTSGVDLGFQRDGKIVVGGYRAEGFPFISSGDGYSIFRFDRRGRPDQTFSGNGRLTSFAADTLRDISIQRNGKILAALVDVSGRDTGKVIRYRADGTVDRAFGHGGFANLHRTGIEDAVDLRVIRNRRILVAGSRKSGYMVARLKLNGSLDRRFGNGDGTVSVDVDGDRRCNCDTARSMAIQPSGRILVAGWADPLQRFNDLVAVAGFTRKGRLDRGFGKHHRGFVRNKIGIYAHPYEIAAGSRSRLWLAGMVAYKHGGSRIMLIRYRRDGRLDRSFSHHGIWTRQLGTSSDAQSVLIQSNRMVVLVGGSRLGQAQRLVLVRFRPPANRGSR